MACRLSDVHEIKHSTLVLGDWRAAQRIEFLLGNGDGVGAAATAEPSPPRAVRPKSPPPGALASLDHLAPEPKFKVWVVNTHLDHEHADTRQSQAAAVAAWMAPELSSCSAVVLCGDFNGGPEEPFHGVLQALGYRSGYLARHGAEPQGTWPTGIQAPLMDRGPRECLDYVYVWAAPGFDLQVLDAAVYGAVPDPKDPTLYPSDHAAVKVTLRLEKLAGGGGEEEQAGGKP